MSVTSKRQYTPEGYLPLPRLRLFRVSRPHGMSDEMVEATGVQTEAEGVLTFSEMVYEKNPLTGEPEMLRYTRRSFRVWSDMEEIVGGLPLLTTQLQ